MKKEHQVTLLQKEMGSVLEEIIAEKAIAESYRRNYKREDEDSYEALEGLYLRLNEILDSLATIAYLFEKTDEIDNVVVGNFRRDL